MSTFRTPVGPQPPRVYWRRRLVVGLALLAVIVIIVMIVSQLNRGTPTSANSNTPSPSPSVSSTDAPVAEAGDECDPAKITLDPIVDASDFQPGVNPQLSFTLKSSMTEPCTLPAGSDVQEFRITSGEELIWNSTDCQVDPVAAVITLQPGVPKQGPSITWDRTRSSTDTCNTAREQVIAGGASYHLDVTVGEVVSDPAKSKQFLLY